MYLAEFEDGLRIFREVFGKGINKSSFYNKHYNNPYRLKNPMEFYYDNDNAVGMNCFMGLKLKYYNEEFYVSLSNDTAVLKQYRGKGIFTSIVMNHLKEKKQDEFIIGQPNNNSYPGFLKMGFREITQLRQYVRINYIGLVLNQLGIKKQNNMTNVFKGIEVSIVDEVYFEADEISSINNTIQVGIKRSNEYFDWKINKNPKPIKCAVFRKNTTLIGYVIFHYGDNPKFKSIIIDDWFALDDNTTVLKIMISYLIRNVDYITVPFVNKWSKDQSILKKCKFFDITIIKKNKRRHFIVSPDCRLDKIDKIQFRYLDGDVILN